MSRCPGSLWYRQPIPEPITCPGCGKEVEIFTNEQSMRCYYCGTVVTRKVRPSCFDWCKYADICMEDFDAHEDGGKSLLGGYQEKD